MTSQPPTPSEPILTDRQHIAVGERIMTFLDLLRDDREVHVTIENTKTGVPIIMIGFDLNDDPQGEPDVQPFFALADDAFISLFPPSAFDGDEGDDTGAGGERDRDQGPGGVPHTV